MRWSDERYVRLYTRDTIAWKRLPWQSRALLPLVLRVADRAGLVDLEGYGAEGLADLVMLPVEVVQHGLMGLINDGTITLKGGILTVLNFLEAQEIPISDAQRKREQRARDRAKSLEENEPEQHHAVTKVTDVRDSHETSRFGHSDPICSEPSEPTCDTREQAPARVIGADWSFAGFWGKATGVAMPDGQPMLDVKRKLESWAELKALSLQEAAEHAVAAYESESASWTSPQALTTALFLRKWEAIQARMEGKVPEERAKKSVEYRGPKTPRAAVAVGGERKFE